MFKRLMIYNIILCSLGCSTHKLCTKEKLIIEVAKKEWKRVFNDDFTRNEPFKILLEDSVWIVKGSLSRGKDGGVPVAIIDTMCLNVIEVYHTK
jgi:hypothetical protein